MKAIILAAGRGSRMKKLTSNKPKCLTNINGKPILEWQLEAFKKAGLTEVAIVTGYRRNLLTKYSLVEFHNHNWAKTNMIYSLACAENWLKQTACVITYGDIFFDYSALLSLKNSTSDIAITYDPNWQKLWEKRFKKPLLDAETFKLDDEGSVIEIGKKPTNFKDIQGQFMGLIKLTPKGWSVLHKTINKLNLLKRHQIDTTSALRKVIETNSATVTGIKYDMQWGEVDLEADLLVYKNYIL